MVEALIQKNNPKVCVLLAAYNGRKFIDQQIASILSQVGVDVTIFVSVDVSSDFTYEYLACSYQNVPSVILLAQTGRFGNASKNFFRLLIEIDFADFDYISFSDQDDIWFDDKLDLAIFSMSASGADGHSSNMMAFWSNGLIKLIDKAQGQREFDFLFESGGPGCTYVITRSLAYDFKHFLQTSKEASSFFAHDWLIYAFARVRGYKWVIDKDAGLLYRQHANNQVGANVGMFPILKRTRFVLFGDALHYVDQLLRMLHGFNDSLPKSLDRRSAFFFLVRFNQIRRRPIERYFAFLVLLKLILFGLRK